VQAAAASIVRKHGPPRQAGDHDSRGSDSAIGVANRIGSRSGVVAQWEQSRGATNDPNSGMGGASAQPMT